MYTWLLICILQFLVKVNYLSQCACWLTLYVHLYLLNLKVTLSFPNFLKTSFKKLAYIHYNKMLLMKESVLGLKENNNKTLVCILSNCPQVLTIFFD